MCRAEQEERYIIDRGHMFIVGRTADGNCYVSIPALCDALGLTVSSQVRRVKRNAKLLVGLRHLQMTTKGGVQRINCLHTECLEAWFDGVQVNALSGQAQETFWCLQAELLSLLSQAFSEQAALSFSPSLSMVPLEECQYVNIASDDYAPLSPPTIP